MESWESALIPPDATILDAMKIIDSNSPLLTALVVDKNRQLLGTVTDGDIRRGILKSISMDASIKEIMFTKPVTLSVNDSQKKITHTVARYNQLRAIPILDERSKIIGIHENNNFSKKKVLNSVFIMAGGLGTRLRPLTDTCPKPMLTVGDKPILEIIINSFIENGFSNFYLSINYKGEMIEDYFGDGSNWGISIKYLKEKKRLGTAGSLSLLDPIPEYPIIVMNGDLLTKVNFQQLLDFHNDSDVPATLCVREHDFQIPFGVAKVDNYRLSALTEKPVEKVFVNAGIYVLNPETLSLIPHDQFYDMPDLFSDLLAQGSPPGVFPVREYWLDIGLMSEYEKADEVYSTFFR